MQVQLEYRKSSSEQVDYVKDGKAGTFMKNEAQFECPVSGDQVKLRFKDLEPFKTVRKGEIVIVSFSQNDKGMLVDSKFVGKVNGLAKAA